MNIQGYDQTDFKNAFKQIQRKDWFTSETLTGAKTIPANAEIKTYYCNGNFTVTLPAAVDCADKILEFVNISNADVTIAPVGTDTMNGSILDPLMEEKYWWIRLKSDGVSDWKVLGTNFWYTEIRCYRNGNQNIPNAVWTVIQYNAENWDRLGEWDTATYRFTPKFDDYYTMYCSAQMGALTFQTNFFLRIRKNAGANIAQNSTFAAGPTGNNCGWYLSDRQYLLTTDFIDFGIYINIGGGAAKQLLSGSQKNWAFIKRG